MKDKRKKKDRTWAEAARLVGAAAALCVCVRAGVCVCVCACESVCARARGARVPPPPARRAARRFVAGGWGRWGERACEGGRERGREGGRVCVCEGD